MEDILDIISASGEAILRIFGSRFTKFDVVLEFDFPFILTYAVVVFVASIYTLFIIVNSPKKLTNFPFNPLLNAPKAILIWVLLALAYWSVSNIFLSVNVVVCLKYFLTSLPTATALCTFAVFVVYTIAKIWHIATSYVIGNEHRFALVMYFPMYSVPINVFFCFRIGREVGFGIAGAAVMAAGFGVLFFAISLVHTIGNFRKNGFEVRRAAALL